MKDPAAGDRVAWAARACGIVVAVDPACARNSTVAVWRGGRFLNHVTRIPSELLRSTSTLAGENE